MSALLRDQCSLQSSPSFQHRLVWHLFRTLVYKGGSFPVHVSTRVVSELVPRCCVMRVKKTRTSLFLTDIIINCFCHHGKILIHGHRAEKLQQVPRRRPVTFASLSKDTAAAPHCVSTCRSIRLVASSRPVASTFDLTILALALPSRGLSRVWSTSICTGPSIESVEKRTQTSRTSATSLCYHATSQVQHFTKQAF